METLLYTQAVLSMERPAPSRIAHAITGIASEAGELAALLKKSMVSGEPIDPNALLDELGDVLYYVALGVAAADHVMVSAMAWNMRKLRMREKNGKNKAAEALALAEFVEEQADVQ